MKRNLCILLLIILGLATTWQLQPEADALPPLQTTSPVNPGAITRVTYSPGSQQVAVHVSGDPNPENNGLFYTYSDHLGSASAMSDANGQPIGETTRYLPFGEYRSGSESELTDRGFTGHKHNDDLGLIYMNARFYVGSIGRFASADTIVPDSADPQAYNRYAYVRNNPMKYTDPTGHCWGSASAIRNNPFASTICEGIDNVGAAISEAVNTVNNAANEWGFYNNPCGMSMDPICSYLPTTSYGSPSPSEITNQILSQVTANSWGGVTPDQIKQISQLTDLTARIIALNNLFGSPPTERIEESYEFATSPRQEQVEQFAEYYFGDLGFDIIYTDSFGEGHFGRHIDPGGEFQGIVYERGALIISESSIQKGWDDVGTTLFHEWLEKYRGELIHEEIHDLEKLWQEWRDQ